MVECACAVLAVLLLDEAVMRLCAQPDPSTLAQREILLPEIIIDRMSRSEKAQILGLKHYTSIRTYHLDNRPLSEDC